MKKRLLLIGFLISISHSVWSYPYSEIYVFGDSLSDTGQSFEAIGMPPAPYYQGRFSNGPVWIELLADYLNLTENSYNPQTNFAWGGATTGTRNTLQEGLPALQQQIADYLQTNPTADPNALYVVWAGGNDLLYPDESMTPEVVIATGVTNIVKAVNQLREHGAQHILVPNLPDLGRVPRSLANGDSEIMTQRTLSFNQALADNLQFLDVIRVDIPTAQQVVISPDSMISPTLTAITNSTEPCFDRNLLSVCDTSFNYFYWDDIHPSSTVHQTLALVFYAAVANPTFISFSEIELSFPSVLRFPAIEIINDNGRRELAIDVLMSLNDELTWRFPLLENALLYSSSLPFQNLVQFANPVYPTFNSSTGILHLPMVHLANQVIAVNDGLELDFSPTTYQADLQLESEMSRNPFQTPSFLLINLMESASP